MSQLPPESPLSFSTVRTGGLPDPPLTRDTTALLIIDMQYLDAHRNFGIGAWYEEDGRADEVDEYFTRIENIVAPNIQRLLEAGRSIGLPVVHVHIAGKAADGSDFSWRFKELGYVVLPGSKDAQILDELAPRDGEIVISKTTAGAFNSTNLGVVLDNMGVNTLITAGVVTNGCVETTVRDAGDRGYRVLLAEDGCAAPNRHEHDYAIRFLDRNFAVVKTTDVIITEIEALRT